MASRIRRCTELNSPRCIGKQAKGELSYTPSIQLRARPSLHTREHSASPNGLATALSTWEVIECKSTRSRRGKLLSTRAQWHGTRVAGDESLFPGQTASVPQRPAGARPYCPAGGGTLLTLLFPLVSLFFLPSAKVACRGIAFNGGPAVPLPTYTSLHGTTASPTDNEAV